VRLRSRNQKDFQRRFPGVVRAVAELPDDTVIDGEIVALDQSGKPSFSLLQGFGGAAQAIVLYVFDLLMLRGKDARFWRLEDRREQLCELVQHLPDTTRYSVTFDVPLSELIRAVRKHQLDGIVAKRAGSGYRSGERCGDCVKYCASDLRAHPHRAARAQGSRGDGAAIRAETQARVGLVNASDLCTPELCAGGGGA
jgi:ATP-dependent DNA ligase